ncbi:hypothetical protein BDW67DRAFT_158945 [Aspergillus spinulosporus]
MSRQPCTEIPHNPPRCAENPYIPDGRKQRRMPLYANYANTINSMTGHGKVGPQHGDTRRQVDCISSNRRHSTISMACAELLQRLPRPECVMAFSRTPYGQDLAFRTIATKPPSCSSFPRLQRLVCGDCNRDCGLDCIEYHINDSDAGFSGNRHRFVWCWRVSNLFQILKKL